ncbi:hypothetical protein [Bacteriophage Titan-X]|uniref:Uncharacterized protein n=1 Tax=Bacteriophage Titan-X TaxID=2662140 RepID=A0A5Q2U7A0_9CAUD|nr:hypothetical protein [Bacteriophage Titan-X]
MTEQVKEKVLMTLHPKQLAVVRQRCGLALSVNSNTTPLEAGVQLGMARVLDILREGFTVDTSVPNTNDG